MHQIIYCSSTAGDVTQSQLDEILSKSRERNSKNGITGLLVHVPGHFFQVLEGEQACGFENL